MRVGTHPPAKARTRQQAPQRKKPFANPFVVAEAKPSRAACALGAAAVDRSAPAALARGALSPSPRSPSPASSVLWRFGRNDAASLPTAAVAAASRPTPEPPLHKADTAPLDGVAGDIWIHPLAGPERRMPMRDSRLVRRRARRRLPSECRGGHCGIDPRGAYGEPVFAVHDGVVERVQRGPNPDHGGRYVRLVHRDGAIATQYFHLSEIPRRIVEGASVKAGEVVGFVGLTGVKHSEPHLHFTVEVRIRSRDDGRYLDREPLVALWPLRVSRKAIPSLRLTNGGAAGFGARLHPSSPAHRHTPPPPPPSTS